MVAYTSRNVSIPPTRLITCPDGQRRYIRANLEPHF